MPHLFRVCDETSLAAAPHGSCMPTSSNFEFETQRAAAGLPRSETPPRASVAERKSWTPPPAPRCCRVRPRHVFASSDEQGRNGFAKAARVLDFGSPQQSHSPLDASRELMSDVVRSQAFARAARKLEFPEPSGQVSHVVGLQTRCPPRQRTSSSNTEAMLKTVREMTDVRKLRSL
eukprot:CAMPEP_0177760514 /NCGR_PEP_ID=MMETSP0491_2-20121128/5306_1 /TAXON_ID=63592 /ORGANISM="Tetraselmis chuii, Strain PLY429" /LENGTH=175 /DNA_ID=CAMNT_0019276415 /DNA_START=154 /DNA_END=681 /DNA_ORIENTATION=+